jgi:hypothetical protein
VSSSPQRHISEKHIQQSYIDPIRSVILIDDQFPSYGQLIESTADEKWEKELAASLWTTYRKKNWSCQVESFYEDTTEYEHVTKHDLIILDYHLRGEDYEPALKLLRKLTIEPRAHFVVLYTQEPNLAAVLRRIAIYLRGTDGLDSIFDQNEDLKTLWDDSQLSIVQSVSMELIDFHVRGLKLNTSSGYKELHEKICEVLTPIGSSKAFPQFLKAATATAQRSLLPNVASLSDKLIPSSSMRMSAIDETEHLWIWRDNLFVTLVNKRPNENGEGSRIITQLTNSLLNAAPSPLELTLAYARDAIHKAGFQTEFSYIQEQPRQAGWWYHVLSATREDKEERITNLANCLLTDMIQLETIVDTVRRFCSDFEKSQDLQGDAYSLARKLGKCADSTTNVEILHALNEFLCSEPFSGNSIRTGTIFKEIEAANTNQYLICVSPACDMVPRKPTQGWLKQLHPIKPFSVIVAMGKPISKESLKVAEQGRELFITDKKRMVIEAISSDSRQPALEVLFAENSARVEKSGIFSVTRIVEEDGRPSFKSIKCQVVGQLRSPYANRLLHATGSHLSRVGVDFLQDRPSDSQSSDGEK